HDDDSSFNMGRRPYGSLVLAGNGSLYGMTSEGGTGHDNGLILKYNPLTNHYEVVFEFSDVLNGSSPEGDLMKANDDNFYGTTSEGGANGAGVLFRFNAANNQFTKLHDFGGSSGSNPAGFLDHTADKKIYGLTAAGGNGYGTIFEWNPEDSAFQVLYSFDASKMNGAEPVGGMTVASNGLLYAMASAGGQSDK